MTANEYQELSAATEAPVTPELSARIHNAKLFASLAAYMGKAIAVAGDLDNLKKHIYYGKKLAASSLLPHPHSEESQVDPSLIQALNPRSVRLLHAAIGLITEAAEIADAVMKGVMENGGEFDLPNLNEEGGDLMWYTALLGNAADLKIETMMRVNVNKLQVKRYKAGKFTANEALTRDLVAERGALEAALLQPDLGRVPVQNKLTSHADGPFEDLHAGKE